MKRISLFLVCAATAFASCNDGAHKKVLIMGRGTLTANENNITLKEGSGYAETMLELSGNEETKLNVDAAQKSEVIIPAAEGFYILNLRNDTVVGARQNLGTDLSSNRVITQEELKVKIDSLEQLTTGANVKEGGSNYAIAPGSVTKVSSNPNARVYGPFTKIPGTLKAEPDGKDPELYKFYTNTEMRELIQKLKAQTVGEVE